MREDDISGSIPPRIKIRGILETAMKQIILLFLLLVGAMFFTAWLSQPGTDIGRFFAPAPQPSVKEVKNIIKINNAEIEVEIAKTPEDRKTGLAKYEGLDKNKGMLFVFEEKDVKPVFWMKDVKFSIDIVWIDDGKVIEISENIPPVPANTPDYKIPRYQPAQTIDQVLEISTGEADRKGIKAGDAVELPQGI